MYNFSGATQPKRYGAGMYPGVGVAVGGQQSRAGFITNGVGGVHQGGSTHTSSQTRPTPSWTDSSGHLHTVRPPRPVTHGPDVSVGIGHIPPKPVVDPFAKYRDSTYFTDRLGLQTQLDSAIRPALSELNGLQSGTLYDTLYKDAQDKWLQDLHHQRVVLASHGGIHSGAANRLYRNTSADWQTQANDLLNKVGGTWNETTHTGTGRIGALQQQQLQAQQEFDKAMQLVDQSAVARANERAHNESVALYGYTPPAVPNYTGG